MTIKTLSQAKSNISLIEKRKSDMQKRGAVRNLFNTTVDRGELQQQLKQMEAENKLTLQSYKFESVIGLIDRPEKPAPSRKIFTIDSPPTSWSPSSPAPSPSREDFTIDSPPTSSSSSSPTPSPTVSSKKSDVKLVQQIKPLPKGQRIIKGKNR